MTTWAGSRVRSARAYWAARLRAEGALPCALCKRPVTADQRWTVEHLVPRTNGGSVTDRANQWVSHARCNYSAGGRIGAARTNARHPATVTRMTAERERGIRGW